MTPDNSTPENAPENEQAARLAADAPSTEAQSEPRAEERPKRRRRKATASQSAPEKAPQAPAVELAPAPAAGTAVEEVVQAAGAESEPQAEPGAESVAPSRPKRRRRATAAQAAPEAAAPADEHPVLASADAAAEPGAPVESAERGHADETVDVEASEPAVDDTPAGSADESDDEAEVDAEDEPQGEGDGDDEEGGDEPVLPAASLLFQTPDPTRARRRRRATAATGSPKAAPAAVQSSFGAGADEGDEEEALKRARRSSRKASGEKASSSQDNGSETVEEESAPKGRGRRRRKVTAEAAAPEHVEEAPGTPASDDADEAEDRSTGAAEEPSKGRGRRRRKARSGRSADAQDDGESTSTDDEEDESVEDADSEGSDDAQESGSGRRKRRRGGRGRRSRSRGDDRGSDESSEDEDSEQPDADASADDGEPGEDSGDQGSVSGSSRRRRRRSRSRSDSGREGRDVRDEVTALKGSTRLEAKRQRRREGRAAGRRRPVVTEAEFLARRESVDRQMIVREQDGLNQIAVLEDGLLVEHYVARHTQTSMVGNVYVGRVQNVLPSMEAAFVDLGKGRNAVLYAGEVNWDAAGMEGKPRRIEDALKSGDTVLVQVTKDPIGHKGARLTSQITLAGRYLVLVPGGSMTGISRKLPDTERARLKRILKRIVPDDAGVIVRTAAEGATEEQLKSDVDRLAKQWESIDKKSSAVLKGSGKAPVLLKGEPELAVRVVRDVFNEDFGKLIVQGPDAWKTISEYVTDVSPDLAERLEHWVSAEDVFTAHRVDEQLAKGFDRKVWLPSGGTLIIDRTEAMTVIDVNTGRFTGAGGTLEETVTRNNIEAAEEIVRQLRLRDIGGMVVIDFVDMVLESNRDLVLRRLVECLGRDRTRHQVTEVTSLGLVQMTRKRVGQGLVEAFSTQCEECGGRGFIVHENPVENQQADMSASASRGSGSGRGRGRGKGGQSGQERSGSRKGGKGSEGAEKEGAEVSVDEQDDATREAVRRSLAQIAAAAEQAHKEQAEQPEPVVEPEQPSEQPAEEPTDTASEPSEEAAEAPVTDETAPAAEDPAGE
ncbi:Rne/Rng family ribonuclease [Actinomyces radicidentis]|uniref:Rne/Rng family ribonuclease n=2 Tax=Actinomyces radicidentis TaxID=111015 RepID=UPI000A044E4B|nr:Rne/Rng family ribonuclease [Actinomyces radicidentis]